MGVGQDWKTPSHQDRTVVWYEMFWIDQSATFYWGARTVFSACMKRKSFLCFRQLVLNFVGE